MPDQRTFTKILCIAEPLGYVEIFFGDADRRACLSLTWDADGLRQMADLRDTLNRFLAKTEAGVVPATAPQPCLCPNGHGQMARDDGPLAPGASRGPSWKCATCGIERMWPDAGVVPAPAPHPQEAEYTDAEVAALRADFDVWLAKRNIPESVRRFVQPWRFQASEGPFEFAWFCRHDGQPIETVADVVETLTLSAGKSPRAELFGVCLAERDEDGKQVVVCYTGNGPRSEANARLIARLLSEYRTTAVDGVVPAPAPQEEHEKTIAILQLAVPLEDELNDKIGEMLKYLAMGDGFTLNGIGRLLVDCQRRMASDWVDIGGLRRSKAVAEDALARLTPLMAEVERRYLENFSCPKASDLGVAIQALLDALAPAPDRSLPDPKR